VQDAIVHPWTGGVGAEELFIAPHVLRLPEYTVGGLISPSSCLIPVMADLVRTSTASSRHPLLLRALLPYSNYMIAVPLPANNYFLNVLTSATGPSLYFWFCLSAAAEYLISRGLQPAPRSACLEPLISYPDWEEFTSTFVTDTEPLPDITTFLIDTGFLALGHYTRFMSQYGAPPGVTRLQLGQTFYCDEVLPFRREQPLLLPMLVAVSMLPSVFLQSYHQEATDETDTYLELLQLLLLSIAVQLELQRPCPGVRAAGAPPTWA